MTTSRTRLPQWQALEAHAAELSRRHLRDLFATGGPGRFGATSLQALDLLYDYSRQRVTPETLSLLTALAEACDLPARIAALEAEQKTITEQLADNDLYAKSPAQVPVLQARFAQIDEDLLAAMERWEALSAPA